MLVSHMQLLHSDNFILQSSNLYRNRTFFFLSCHACSYKMFIELGTYLKSLKWVIWAPFSCISSARLSATMTESYKYHVSMLRKAWRITILEGWHSFIKYESIWAYTNSHTQLSFYSVTTWYRPSYGHVVIFSFWKWFPKKCPQNCRNRGENERTYLTCRAQKEKKKKKQGKIGRNP